MKTNLIYVAALVASVMLLMSACQSSDDLSAGGPTPERRGKALMNLSFELPDAGEELDVAEIENLVSTVDAFVFEPNGEPARIGSHTRFDSMEAFSLSVVGSDVVYELEESGIVTVSGAKTVYVGINMPASLFSEFAGDEAEMLDRFSSVSRKKRPGDFIVYSEPRSVVLERRQRDVAPADNENEIEVAFDIVIMPWARQDVEVIL
ncbi:MAG: hypothetical protein LBV38_05910 [Alistipes sp.]|jgi:hypothetical protein|nr:hypothetical protein [Alistipes sp.]